MIKVSVDDARKLAAKFERTSLRLESELEKRMAVIVENIKNDAILEAPVKSGALRASIGSRKIGKMKFEVSALVPYSRFVHNGTRYIKPNPFLYRSWNINRKDLLKAVKRATGDIL
ncbi:HK97-gp10 family putative phage morphogenesis protein [Priestia megaterium]